MQIFVFTDNENSIYVNNFYRSFVCGGYFDGLCRFAGLYEGDLEAFPNEVTGIISAGKYFLVNDIPISENKVNSFLKDYDAILPYEGKVVEVSLLKQYVSLGGNVSDINLCGEAIKTHYPDYTEAFDFVMNRAVIFEPGQMILPNRILQGYISFVKGIYQIAGDRISDSMWDILSGWLLKVYLMMEKIRIRSVTSEKRNPQIWHNATAKIELTKQYIDMRLAELVQLRLQTGFGSDSLIDGFEVQDDFEGKTPVWVCWWQGEDAMPELVRACVDSIKRNLPDKASFRLITFDNWNEYVCLSDAIIEKYNSGIISLTHLSDVLRSELLYRYGGMWIDATIYVSRPIEESVLNANLYSLSFRPKLWELDIMEGRWTTSLWSAAPGSPLFQFVTEAWLLYWETENEIIDYFTFDYIIDTAYRHFDNIKKCIDEIPTSPEVVYSLQLRMNQRCSGDEIEKISKESCFYKLNRRNEYKVTTPQGHRTVFGYICGVVQVDDESTEGTYVITKELFESFRREQGLAALFEDIRYCNPTTIIDDGMNLAEYGLISEYMLPDILYGRYKLLGKKREEHNDLEFCLFDCLYENI